MKIFTFLRIASILLRQFSQTQFLIFFQKFGSTNLLSDCKILNFYFLKIIFPRVATAWVATTLGCKVYGLQQVWVATYWVATAGLNWGAALKMTCRKKESVRPKRKRQQQEANISRHCDNRAQGIIKRVPYFLFFLLQSY